MGLPVSGRIFGILLITGMLAFGAWMGLYHVSGPGDDGHMNGMGAADCPNKAKANGGGSARGMNATFCIL